MGQSIVLPGPRSLGNDKQRVKTTGIMEIPILLGGSNLMHVYCNLDGFPLNGAFFGLVSYHDAWNKVPVLGQQIWYNIYNSCCISCISHHPCWRAKKF